LADDNVIVADEDIIGQTETMTAASTASDANQTSNAVKRVGFAVGMRSALALCVMFGAAVSVPDQGVAQKIDFVGQKVTLVIGTPVGGGYDLYGRLIARFLGAYLPGNPTIVPQNMPGAGSLIAANWLYNVAPKDGTAIGILPSATVFENLLGNASARFDARKFNWLASLNDYTAVAVVWHEAPFRTAGDLLTRELLVGSNAPASDSTIWPLLLNALIGTRTRVVKGYQGTAGIALAMERGEVQGMIGDDWASIKANKRDWLRDQKIRILMQLTATRHADLPDVPTVGEFASTEDNRRVLRLFVDRQRYGRPFLAPPGTPGPVVEAYREAFGKVVRDPGFVREAEQAQLIIKVASGDDMENLVEQIYGNPKSVIEHATSLLRSISE
jgi:tripartite-type tricarboxylate transporter receptor subunit TctC